MKKLILCLFALALQTLHVAGQACPDCNTMTFTATNATGYGCTGELKITYNTACPTQVQVTGTTYDGNPYSDFSNLTPPFGHWNLKAGSYSFQLFSFDGLTLQCSTAVIPFTITQPVCDFDLQHSFGTPDYCLGSIPVNIWSTNQGCTNLLNGIANRMVIGGITCDSNSAVTIDLPLNDAGTFTAANFDFVNGNLQLICSEDITITTPGCGFSIAVASTAGTQCNKHKITLTQTGNTCGGEWYADLFHNGNYDTTLSSTTSTMQFLNLTNGNYEVTAYTGVCTDTKLITLNYCPKPYGTSSAEITASSAKVKWTKQTCAVGYNVQYRALGATTWISKTVTTNAGNKVLTGLAPATTYQWKVRTKCANSPAFYSGYSSIKTFTTLSAREGDVAIAAEKIELRVFPNPAKGAVTISADMDDATGTCFFFNTTGQLISQKAIDSDDGTFESSFDISNFRPGMYLVMIKTSTGIATRRFIKE